MFHSSQSRWTAAFLLVSALALGWLIVTEAQPTQTGEEDRSSGSAASTSFQTDASGASSGDVSGEDVSAGETDPAGSASSEPAPSQPDEPKPELSPYDFSQPVPESEEVDLTYFDDSAFVGDSRTDGFLIYSGIGRGKNLTSNGLSIFKLDEKKALTIGGEKYTLMEALALEQYGEVYLSLGVNELGYYDDQGFYDSYCKAIDDIRALQPNAVIYIQGLIPLNEDVIKQTGGREYLTNEHLRVYNDLMKKAAEEKQVVFLDLYTEFVDGNGQLPAEASKDGVHLRGDWCKQWLAYLQTHTVDFDALYPDGAPQPELPQVQEPETETENGSAAQ